MTDYDPEAHVGPQPDGTDPPTAVAESHDLSMHGTPQGWFEAERDSPQDLALAAARRRTRIMVAPIRRKTDGGTLFLSGLVAAILTGAAWMSAELLGLFGSPWLAVPAGILIALIIRTGSGRLDPQSRSTASAIVYLVTFLVVMALLTRREINDLYGDSTDVLLLEQNLFRRRFSGVEQLTAYAIGWASSSYVSNWLR